MARRSTHRSTQRRTRVTEKFTLPARTALSTAIAATLGLAPTALFANTITPDGRTTTTVAVEGNFTDISTGTVQGLNAFNSFRDFQIVQGNVVNLHLPTGTDNLINLVTDSRAVIDGTLNSLQGGRIAGNVVFADPHGIVVGGNGVINVGSLLLTTPTQAFMDEAMKVIKDADNNDLTVIDDAKILQLLSGNAPLAITPEAEVRVEGRINALGAVALEGRGVILSGEVQAGTDAAHQALFEAVVNTDGLTAATDAVVIDGRVSIRAAEDVTISGLADASSANAAPTYNVEKASGASAGRVELSAGGDITVTDTARLAAIAAKDGGDGGRIAIDAAGSVTVAGALDASATTDVGAGGMGNGGAIAVQAGQNLSLEAGASLAVTGATLGGDGGQIELGADGIATISNTAALDASAGDGGDGGQIKISGSGDLTLDGIDANLAGSGDGADGELLIGMVNVNVGSAEYYTNGGNVTINAGDSLTIGADTTINTRRIDSAKDAVNITPASVLADNPAGLADAAAADLVDTASVGDSGDVLLQAPSITIAGGAKIYTFATDGFNAGGISLVSGDNFTCNICEAREPGDYFSSVDNLSNAARIASTDDVSITVENGAVLDARYRDRTGYNGIAGQGGDVVLSADASDLQVAGWSEADARVTVNGALLGGNVSVSATARAGVDFAWLAALDPANPTGTFTALEEVSSTDFSQIHNNAIENADDLSDLSNLAAIGLPVTAGLAIANARVEVGSGAEIAAADAVSISASASRSVNGASGGLLASSLPALGIGAIFGQVSGTTSAVVSGDASLSGNSLAVTAESNNSLSISADAVVEQGKSGTGKGNTAAAFSLAIGRADVTTEARVNSGVSLGNASTDGPAVEVRATNLDNFTTEASSTAIAATTGSGATSQGAMTVALSLWHTDATAAFDASADLASLDVVADNLSVSRVTKATVQNGNNALDYLVGSKKERKGALDALVGNGYSKSGSSASFRLAGAAAITVSEQNARASIGERASGEDNALVTASGDVTVRSRVVNQGIRSSADSRVNSGAGADTARVSGSVGVAFGLYDHSSHAVIGDGAVISADHIGVGARSELPIDNDYDESYGDFDVTQWSGPADFFSALDSIVGFVLEPDAQALESFGLPDYLLTSYANAYGTAEETAVFGSANATIASQDTRAWVGEGTQLTATAADGEWTSEFGIAIEPDEGEDAHDLDTELQWTWSAGVDVDARSRTETIGVTGNLSLLTLLTSSKEPAGTSVGGSFGWTEFNNTTIAGIGDGAVVRTGSLDVEARTDDRMIIIAPSAGQGDSTAGNGIFSLAQIGGLTHASIHNGAHIDVGVIDVAATHSVNLWAIGGAVAVSSGTSVAAAIAANSIVTDTRAYLGDNSADRVLAAGEDAAAADVTVADGSEAGVRTAALNVDALTEGRVGAIAVAGAVARGEASTSDAGGAGTQQQSQQNGLSQGTQSQTQNSGFLSALQKAGGALGGGGSQPDTNATLTGAGSGTLNFSRINTVAEINDVRLLHTAADTVPDIGVSALSNIDQVSTSGAAAVSLAGGSGGRSTAIAGAVAFNSIDNETRAGLYGISALNGGRVGQVDVLAASSGDALSIGLALAATEGQGSTGAALSASIANIDSDTRAEIEDSVLLADDAGAVSVTGYDRSRALVGGGALYVSSGNGGGGAGLAATYGRIDNDISAFIRGSTLTGFSTIDVNALGASRILAAAFGGSVATGTSLAGAGSFYIMTLDSDLAAGITGSYGTVDDDNDADTPEVTDYDNLLTRSDVQSSGNVTVSARSSAGVAELESQFSAEGGFDSAADFDGDALADVDTEQVGFDLASSPGEAVLGFAGSLAISGGSAAAGLAIGFTDLRGSYSAEIRDAGVTATAGDVNVSAINSRQAIGVAAGASVSGGASLSLLGSGAITLSDTVVSAQVLGDSEISAEHVSVEAAAEGSVYSLAGGLSISASGSAAGAAASYNQIGGSVTASLGGASVITNGTDPSGLERSVDVNARQDALIRSAAIAGAVSGGAVAIGGSATINTITTDTSAILESNAVTADSVRVVVANGSLADPVSIWSLAGSITASNNAGFGAAFALNDLDGSYAARVSGTTFTDTDELTVLSTGVAEVKTLAVSGGGSGSVSAGVSDASSVIGNTVGAYVDDITLQNQDARVAVLAGDRSRIDSLAGAIQGGGTAGVGVAVAVNSIANTVDASLSGGLLDVENLEVDALSGAEIGTVAVGVAVGGTAGLAGSLAINLLDTSTTAGIDGNADVSARHNVGVTAASEDAIDVVAGAVGVGVSAVGGGLSAVVNHVTSDTEAGISGAGTRVSALALDAGDTLDVAEGDLVTKPDVNKLEEAADYSPVTMTSARKAVTGVAVNAQSLQSVGAFATTVGVSASLGSVAGALTSNTNIVGGRTAAYVDGAAINAEAGAAAGQQADVRASSHAYTANMTLGLAVSGGGSATGTVGADIVNRTTEAYLSGADVSARNQVAVNARTGIGSSLLSAGGAAGIVGGAGSAAFALHDATTLAYLDGGTDISAGSLLVNAEADNEMLLASGALAIGGGALAGAIDLGISSLTTEATVDADYRDTAKGAGNSARLDVDGAVTVSADSNTDISSYAVGAAGGGAIGVAGSVAVNLVENTTRARLSGANVGGASATGNLNVSANDQATLRSFAGAAGIGFGGTGLGAGAHISVIHSTVNALVTDSSIQTSGAVGVSATSDTDVDAISVAAGIGSSAGISGAVSLAVIGSGERGDAASEISGTLDAVADIAASDRTGSSADDGELTAGDRLEAGQRNEINGSGSFDLAGATAEDLADTTTAGISGGQIEAGSVTVTATDSTRLASLVGAVAAGGVGVGGAVTIDRVYNSVFAGITGNSMIVSPGAVSVSAEARDGANGKAIDASATTGAAGIVGLGAAYADARIDNAVNAQVTATIADNNVSGAIAGNDLAVSARDTTTLSAEALGAQAGAAAAGIVVANAAKTSTVDARISDANLLDNRDTTINALSRGGVSANSIAAAGGLLAAASGSVATAVDASDVDAGVYDSTLRVDGAGLNIDAIARPDASAESFGVNVAGYVSVGASIATAEANSTVDAIIGAGSNIIGNGVVDVLALAAPVNTGDDTARAKATGASGAGLFGANATVTDAFSDTRVNAEVETGATLNVNGGISVTATNRSSQEADADSFSVGLIALGANVATAKAEGTTTATFDGAISAPTGSEPRRDLSVRATGEASNLARSEAGNGGVLAGSASSANTRDTSAVTATLGNTGTAEVATLDLSAQHSSNFNTDVDSTQASLVGLSGAWADNEVNLNVKAVVDNGATLWANDIDIAARSFVTKANDGYSIVSGSGGALNAAAAQSETDILLATLVDIRSDADLRVTGEWRDPGRFTVLAENTLNVYDAVKLDAGGAIAIARAQSYIDAVISAGVNVGTNARLETVGELVLASRSDATLTAKSDAKTYGLAGAAEGRSRAAVTASHAVDIGAGADLQSYGDTRLYAGRNDAGAESQFNLTARTDLWNKTAFPVETDPDADARVNQTGVITIADNARVASVSDVILLADKGQRNLVGRGIGKDLYRQAAEDIANGLGSLVGAEEVSLDITAGSTSDIASTQVVIDGSVEAGIYNEQYLTLDYTNDFNADGDIINFQVVPLTQSEGVSYRVLQESYSQTLKDRLDRLYTQLDDYSASPIEKAAFQSEINLIEDQLEQLGLDAGLTLAQIYPDGLDGPISVPAEFPIFVVELDDIIARPGNIEITADVLRGSGVLDAPGDASIEIFNDTPAFLRTGALTIPDRSGGRVTFNRSLVSSAADVTAINRGNVVAAFDAINTAENSPPPSIVVENRFDNADLDGTLPPDLFIAGNIDNRRGSVKLLSNKGSVLVAGDIRANATDIGAGENVVLSYIDSFRHIGTDPSGLVDPDPDAVTIAGNTVIVSARYINVNGLIQSGIADWSITIDQTSLDAIAVARAKFEDENGPALARIATSDPLTGTIGYRYDFNLNRIRLDSVEVSGGYMELTGKIMSTGSGELRVLDGYGRVTVNNTTGTAMDIADIDLGNEIEGRIRINDAGLLDGNDNNLTSTIYTRVGDTVQAYRGSYADVDTTYQFRDDTLLVGERSASYNPRAGLDFIWLDGTAFEEKVVETRYSDSAIGFIPSGSGDNTTSVTYPIGEPRVVPGSEYLTEGLIPVADRPEDGTYTWATESFESDESEPRISNPYNYSTCEVRALVCLERRYWTVQSTTYGRIAINRRGEAADQTIDVNFIGEDVGSVDIDSLGAIVFSGSVLNGSGTTAIKGAALSQIDSDAVIEANNLNLTSVFGIGTTADLRVSVADTLQASNVIGDINIDGVSGDLQVGSVTTGFGNVSLSAQDNLRTTPSGMIRGNAINLTARQGAVGQAGAAVRIDSGNSARGMVNASGPQGVFLLETTGDLRVGSIDGGAADVSLTVAAGALLDANSTESIDERADEEIQNLWTDMELTGADADDALERERTAQARSGQSRYERYWDLRGNSAILDDDGNITGYTADAFDVQDATFSPAQQDALIAAYDWEPAEVNDRLAELQAQRISEYESLNSEFGAGAAYNPDFQYVLSQAESDALGQGHAWTTDQLSFSISRGMATAPGANTGVIDEDPNISGRNISISAASVGRTLDETLVIDLSDGVRALTDAERRALATAEFDDVAVDPDNSQIITIVQRDDVDLVSSGHITVSATGNGFIGGEQDLNLYNVSGQAVRIKTDGSVTTARAGETVLTGTNVIIEGSNGDIGSADARLGTAITGELTARTTGGVFLDQIGDLSVNRILGESGIDLLVSGSLIAAQDIGATLTGGTVNLNVLGDIGSADRRFNIALGLNDALTFDTTGSAWIGAEQGLVPFAGDLLLGATVTGGRLDIGNVTDLLLDDRITVGGLTVDLLGNWTIGEAGALASSGTVDAAVAGAAGLRNVTVTDASDEAFVVAAETIEALGTDNHLDVTGGIDLDTNGDIASSTAPLRVGASRVDAASLTGDVYLHFFRDITSGGDIASITGETLISADASANLDSLFGQARVVADSFAGTLAVSGQTASGGLIDLTANELVLGTVAAVDQVNLAAVTDIGFESVASSGANVSLMAGANITGTTVTALASVDLNSQGDTNLGSVTSTGAGILLTAGGNITGGSLGAVDDVRALVGGILDLETVSAANIVASAGGAAIANGIAESEVRITSTRNLLPGGQTTTGNQNHGILRAADLIELIAEGEIRFGELYAGRPGDPLGTNGDVVLDAGVNVIGNLIDANRDIAISALGDLRVNDLNGGGLLQLDAGRNIFASVGGDITDVSITADNNVELYALGTQPGSNGDILLSSLTAGGRVVLDAAGDLRILPVDGAGGFVSAGATASFRAGGDIEIPNVIAGGAVTASGTNLSFDSISSGADVSLNALGDLLALRVESAGRQNLSAGDRIDFELLDAGGAIDTVSGGTTSGGSVRGDGPVAMTAGRGELPSGEPDGNGNASILLTSVTAGGAVALDAATDLRIRPVDGEGGFVDAGTTATFRAGDDIEIGDVIAGGDVSATGSTLTFDTIGSGADVSLDALDDLLVLTVDSAGLQNLSARGSFDFERLYAGGTIDTLSGGDTVSGGTGGGVRADSPVTMTAGMNWLASGAPSGNVNTEGNLLLDTVEAPEARLRSGGDTLVEQLRSTRVARLWGQLVRAFVTDTDNGNLEMAVTGGNGGLADRVELDVRSNGELLFDSVYARDARIDTSSDRVTINDGWISDLLMLQTLNTELLMDQLDPSARPVDIQLLELDQRFRLRVDGRDISTDAYIEQYRQGYTTVVPNFQFDHDRMALEVEGESAERNVNRMMQRPDLPLTGNSRLQLPVAPVDAPVESPADEAPVNLSSTGPAQGNDQNGDDDDRVVVL